MAVRQNIIAAHQAKQSISAISREFGVSRTTIYNLLARHQEQGEAGLQPRYAHCGKVRPHEQDFVYRAVRCLKHWHGGWGAEKIRAHLRLYRPQLDLPSVRTMYRWFAWNEQTPPRSQVPRTAQQWAKRLHEGWQVDAKEELRTADGQAHCWLNITDERSGTVIDPPVFPPAQDQ